MSSRARNVSVLAVGVLLAAPLTFVGAAHAADPVPVEVLPPTGVATGGDPSGLDMSADGRWVAYTGRTGATHGLYLLDRTTGQTTTLVTGATPIGDLSVSADGQRVAYVLGRVGSAHDGDAQVRVLDRGTGTSTLVSATAAGAAGNGISWSPDLSEDGTAVAFMTRSTNLVTGTAGSGSDVVVKVLGSGSVERISGTHPTADSWAPTISADGDRVAFVTTEKLATGDTDDVADVVLRTRSTQALTLVSRTAGAAAATAPAISADGRKVAHLVAEGGFPELVHSGVFVTTLDSGATVRASVGSAGDMTSPGRAPALSADGRFVLFTALAVGPGARAIEAYVRDLSLATTRWVSAAGPASSFYAAGAAISGSGRHVLFTAVSVDEATTVWTTDLGDPAPEPAPVSTSLPTLARAKAKGPSYAFVATPGTWQGAEDQGPTYQWLRNGRAIAGATGRTYVVQPADFSKSIAVRETLTPASGTPVSAVSVASKALKPGSDLTAEPVRGRVKAGAPVVLRVRVSHDFGVRPQGKVVVKWGKRSKTVKVDADGRLRVRIPGLRPGWHTLTVRHRGTAFVKAAPVERVSVRVVRRGGSGR